MHSIKTARIKNVEIAQEKRRNKIKAIKTELRKAGIDFVTDKVGKINVAQPCDIFRDIKTNDIVVKQGNL